MDNAEVSAAAPPIADVALSKKQRAMNASRSTIMPPNLKDTKAMVSDTFLKKQDPLQPHTFSLSIFSHQIVKTLST